MREVDSIDRHIEFWSREVADLDPDVEGAVTRMQMLVRHLAHRRAEALASYPLKSWEYDILWRLRSVGKPYRMTPTALTAGLDVAPATLTNRLERLEESGYVSRTHDADDRRKLLVTLTAKGHRAWEATIGAQADAEHELLAPLGTSERKQLVRLLRKLTAAAEAGTHPLMLVPGEEDLAPKRRRS
ncbi:MarR family winged helix-turn-helix transcriptional regulator [Amycolatopsis minnesotensis]|uniref:MarR family transcriptional regulator n=1 Tax=Amycolatopsis minnesotensis TaxID=337894 RepID=A0ABN2R653_9PSEU